MDLASITEKLRVVYKLDQSNYPDSLITSLVNDAVKKISEYYPEAERAFILTVADQTRYTVTHTGLMKVVKVYYAQGLPGNDSVFSDPDIPGQALNWQNTYFPSQAYEQIQSLELYQKLRPSDGEVASYNKFDLIPTPIESGNKVYYDYARYRTLSEIPDIFEENLYQLVFYYISEPDSQKTISDARNNKYFFERRGNISVEKDVGRDLLVRRNEQLSGIVTSIKEKVMKL